MKRFRMIKEPRIVCLGKAKSTPQKISEKKILGNFIFLGILVAEVTKTL